MTVGQRMVYHGAALYMLPDPLIIAFVCRGLRLRGLVYVVSDIDKHSNLYRADLVDKLHARGC